MIWCRRLCGWRSQSFDLKPDGSIIRIAAGEYTSRDPQALLSAWGIEVSLSRKGDCYDHTVMESFVATWKGECPDRQHGANHSQTRQAIFEYLEVCYNDSAVIQRMMTSTLWPMSSSGDSFRVLWPAKAGQAQNWDEPVLHWR